PRFRGNVRRKCVTHMLMCGQVSLRRGPARWEASPGAVGRGCRVPGAGAAARPAPVLAAVGRAAGWGSAGLGSAGLGSAEIGSGAGGAGCGADGAAGSTSDAVAVADMRSALPRLPGQ